MLERINLIANVVMALSSGVFYLMIFTKAAPGFDAAKHLDKTSYWVVRVGLSFFVAGSLLAALVTYSVTVPQFVRNVGTAILFAWSALFHARKWKLITGVKRVDRITGSQPIIK
jgi:hypothetical protein